MHADLRIGLRAIAARLNDMTPTMWDGKMRSRGKKNPVTLVNIVVARKIKVRPSSLLELNKPTRTTAPERIPSRLMTT